MRGYCEPLRAARVDTVILGCTHYPLVRPMLQRMLGRDVTLITPGQAIARRVGVRAGRPRRWTPPPPARATTASCARAATDEFRALGTRFLQLPLGDVEHIDVHAAETVLLDLPVAMSHAPTTAPPTQLRPVTIEPGFVRTATGSALISCGETRVICTASVQESVPKWMPGRGRGWVTAEYGMLPASTGDRKQRDITKGKRRRPHASRSSG